MLYHYSNTTKSCEKDIMSEQNSEDGWWRFLELLTQLKKTEDLDDFFNLFLTIEEKKNIATRYLIIRDLMRGKKTQREMADDLNVSIAKITRGSNALKALGGTLTNFLERKLK